MPVSYACSSEVPEQLQIRIESGDDNVMGERWQSALYVAAGGDPFELVDTAVHAAAAMSGSAKPRQQKQLPPTLDVFGWCTWDAFYSRVSAQGETSAQLPRMHTCCLLGNEVLQGWRICCSMALRVIRSFLDEHGVLQGCTTGWTAWWRGACRRGSSSSTTAGRTRMWTSASARRPPPAPCPR